MSAPSVSGAAAPVLGTPEEPKPKNAQEAAKAFESLLIAQMLREAHGEDDEDPTGSTMLDVANQQFAKLLADKGGFGLSKLIVGGLATAQKQAD
jgi:Rod binding domain-containing protein